MTKIPNGVIVRERFRSLENSNLGIVSDFGFRISNLITDLPKQNKPPVSSKPVMGKDQMDGGGSLAAFLLENQPKAFPSYHRLGIIARSCGR
jgi:hypothetical protein